ncbi:unnamed protein product, partial [Lymnaea stagnalis]
MIMMAAPHANVASVHFLNETCKKKFKSYKNSVILDIGDGKKISGMSTIGKYLLRTQDEFKDFLLEDRMAVEQWLEYRHLIENAAQDSELQKVVLKELNQYLKDKVYFVAQQLTLADILVYHSIYDIFKTLTFLDKEKYINLSRWFSNV